MARYHRGRSGVTATGVDNLTRKLQALAKEVPLAAAYGQYEAMQEIVKDAKNRAPVDTGALRDSGYVAAPDIRGGKSRVEAGFGGYAGPYATRQHETHATKHHFFSGAIDAGLDLLRNTVAKYVNNFLKTGRLRMPPKTVPSTPTEVGTLPRYMRGKGG